MKVNERIWTACESDKPIVIHQGGTSSGKTYGVLQWLFYCGAQNPEVITIFAEHRPALKAGAYRDAKNIVNDTPALREFYPERLHNKSEMIYRGINGTEIEFKSYSDDIDARQGKRHRSFANEANGIKYDIWEMVQLRTSRQSIIDFNPSARFWAHEHLEHREDALWCISTFKDNKFLEPGTLAKILSYEPTPENTARGTANEYRWKVYGLGQLGRLEGLVFPDWEIGGFPDDYKWRVFGMDFGFTNDPTTLIEIRYKGGGLYWHEHIFEQGLTNDDISRRLKEVEHDPDDEIIADSAEPKSIQELCERDWIVKPCVKGADSVINGIDAIHRYKCYLSPKSSNLIEEFSSYTWKLDRNGNPMNKPIDRFNHGIDAGRYALTHRLLIPESKLFSIS
jgi:phage terminase large subunit